MAVELYGMNQGKQTKRWSQNWRVVMGEIVYGSLDPYKDFSFYLEWNEEPLEEFAQRICVSNVLLTESLYCYVG